MLQSEGVPCQFSGEFSCFYAPKLCCWSSWVLWHGVNKILRACFQWLAWRAAEDLLRVLPCCSEGLLAAENSQVFTGPEHGSGGEACTGMWFLAEFNNMLKWARGTCLTLCSCLSQRKCCLLWRCFCLSHNVSSVHRLQAQCESHAKVVLDVFGILWSHILKVFVSISNISPCSSFSCLTL